MQPIGADASADAAARDARSVQVQGLPRKALVADLLERVVILVLFAHFLNTMLGRSAAINGHTILLVIGETLPVAMIFSRGPSSRMSLSLGDWVLGFAGAAAPLLAIAPPDPVPLMPIAACVAIMLAGLTLQVSAKIFLGRSFGLIAANRGVKVNGPYRFVRHPMYAGYTLGHLGYLLAAPNVWNLAVYVLALAIQVLRIRREERLLGTDQSYHDFVLAVRYRLLPGVY